MKWGNVESAIRVEVSAAVDCSGTLDSEFIEESDKRLAAGQLPPPTGYGMWPVDDPRNLFDEVCQELIDANHYGGKLMLRWSSTKIAFAMSLVVMAHRLVRSAERELVG